jgi:hypothetical protein
MAGPGAGAGRVSHTRADGGNPISGGLGHAALAKRSISAKSVHVAARWSTALPHGQQYGHQRNLALARSVRGIMCFSWLPSLNTQRDTAIDQVRIAILVDGRAQRRPGYPSNGAG